jgi:hypothetical protein
MIEQETDLAPLPQALVSLGLVKTHVIIDPNQ